MYSTSILTILSATGLSTALPHYRRQSAMPSATDINCAQSAILSQAIALNIADQQQELAMANNMATILQATPVDTAAWQQSRTALLQFVNNGIAIREANQLITPSQNPSKSGVATVANAQLDELGMSTNLTAMGADDVAGNLAIVKKLQMAFSGGIVQNQKNMADASDPMRPGAFLLPVLAKHLEMVAWKLTLAQSMAGCLTVSVAVVPAPAAPPAPAPAPPAPAPAAPAPPPPPPAGEPQPAPPASMPSSAPEAPKSSAAAAVVGGAGAANAAAMRRAAARGAARLRLAGVGAA